MDFGLQPLIRKSTEQIEAKLDRIIELMEALVEQQTANTPDHISYKKSEKIRKRVIDGK